ncbi:a-glycosyltransferase glycosyltransferase family 4 protein [Bifidobacterium margollesii]|uniref:A-glycosyltransferase glycosyltransferase family 4 protein n=1 Tax=Bifidobacterium margollesii TaxID=2020964 RepID=A0A2N5JBT0_9BIFI|nr:glycosyltransferase [Bifidobacterium margollesii]PLS31641.1 a-glycosyltransferase glycosyltransferase family 4 protein [Bifidobacterium margollesii]
MKKKLLVTASTFPRWMNDTEPKFIYDLCMQLKKYYDVTALVPAAPKAKSVENMEGITVKRFRYFPVERLQTLAYPGAIVPRIKEKKARGLLVPFFFIAQYFATRREMKHCDAVLVNWFVPQGVTQSFLRRKKPYIVSGLGGDVTSLNGFPLSRIKQGIIDDAGAVTVVSDDLKKVLQAKYRNTDDIRVIPMGVDLTFFGPEHRDETLRAKYGKPIVLFVARLVEKKGARYLFEAMKDIDAKLLVVGNGPEMDMLQGKARELELDCDFLGPKNKDELKSIYASCDVFVAPSVIAANGDKDGLPVAILEAMASGAPIVASDIAGIAEAVVDGENGYLTEPKNVASLRKSIQRILDDEESRKEFSTNSVKLAKRFDFASIGEEYHQLIERMLQ